MVVGMAPAHAEPSCRVFMKATGSLYTEAAGLITGMVPTGASKSWSLKIVNTGDNIQQFKVTVQPPGSSDVSVSLFNGYKGVPFPYYTEPIAPGGSAVLTLKIYLAEGTPQSTYAAVVDIRDPETNAILRNVQPQAAATYQTGTLRNDFFLKTGSQPFVGGSNSQLESSAAIKVGQTATFTLRLKNDGASPSTPVMLSSQPPESCPENFSVTVKQGTTDVSTAFSNGTYTTGTFNPGAKLEFKVQIKQLSAAVCGDTGVQFRADGLDGTIFVFAHVPLAAA
jgi:uncharacterized repeat protein (TIGR01451 family)